MRTTMKGGIWKNSEDEILKAAVMKYGLNNWSRVASLLVRKSAKQCKCRWYEWLDPSVKKTEWTREEEEKLLHLAKLFANQWRTIAPVVGRTAHQCLEHYEKLLDQAQNRTDEDRANDPRRLRPGEIDPHPETKPSRADVIDMDDDEKEMLAEARARLANTRGKKAKRKAREKQLEEARRLAALQKRRELKAAGLTVSRWKKKHDAIDYATEIPFEQQTPKGFYAIGPEETPSSIKGFGNVSLQQLEGQRRIDEEKRLRKEDTRKLKRIMDENPEQALQMINKMNETSSIHKKIKLVLPEPQLSEAELKEIVALGKQQSIPTDVVSLSGPSAYLLESGSHVSKSQDVSTQLITPMRTPAVQNTIMLAAKDAHARTFIETPLEGGVNPVMSNVSFGPGAEPQKVIPQTPNILSIAPSVLRAATSSIAGTPFAVATPTPQHSDPHTEAGLTSTELRSQVSKALTELPDPQNEVEIVLAQEYSACQPETKEETLEEDSEDVLKRQRETESYENIIKRQSHVLQSNLPRPMYLNRLDVECSPFLQNSEDSHLAYAEKCIREEMANIIRFEAVKYPTKGTKFMLDFDTNSYEPVSIELITIAEAIIEKETSSFFKVKDADYPVNNETLWNCDNFVYDWATGLLMDKSEAPLELNDEALQEEWDIIQERLQKETKKVKKLEATMSTKIQGYLHRASTLLQSIDTAYDDIISAQCELSALEGLESREKLALERRHQDLKDRLDQEHHRQHQLQKLYAALVSKYTEARQLHISDSSSEIDLPINFPTISVLH